MSDKILEKQVMYAGRSFETKGLAEVVKYVFLVFFIADGIKQGKVCTLYAVDNFLLLNVNPGDFVSYEVENPVPGEFYLKSMTKLSDQPTWLFY